MALPKEGSACLLLTRARRAVGTAVRERGRREPGGGGGFEPGGQDALALGRLGRLLLELLLVLVRTFALLPNPSAFVFLFEGAHCASLFLPSSFPPPSFFP